MVTGRYKMPNFNAAVITVSVPRTLQWRLRLGLWVMYLGARIATVTLATERRD